MNIVICTTKTWNIEEANKLKKRLEGQHHIVIVHNKEDLNYDNLKALEAQIIFFPHWSYIIPKDIYENWKCIVFHMTDLPFGRGGSPLQNLIVRGIKETKISAIRVNDTIDGGPVYLKESLNLNGSAEEIFIAASKIIFGKMLPRIIEEDIIPQDQEGEIVNFKRRTPQQSELNADLSLEQIYDYIRMLDGEGYPKAYLTFGKYKFQFSKASLKGNKIIADVEIMEDKQ